MGFQVDWPGCQVVVMRNEVPGDPGVVLLAHDQLIFELIV